MHTCSAEHPTAYLPSQRLGLNSSNPVSPNGISGVRERYQHLPNLPGNGKYYSAPSATAGAQSDRYSGSNYIYSSGVHASDPSRLLPSSIVMPSTSSSYGAQPVSDSGTPPFNDQQNFYDIYSSQSGTDKIVPEVNAKIEKGFFYSTDGCWTCYRRNYFAVQCSYTLTPHLSNMPLTLMKDGKSHTIQAMAMSLSARVDGTSGKSIELVQHTPKRDKGPQNSIAITRLCPTPPHAKLGHLPHAEPHAHFGGFGFGTSGAGQIPPPFFPLQSALDPNSQPQDPANSHHSAVATPTAHQHTFERIQFKSATANNGKRRAQQQYYHLIVELHADIRESTSSLPKWVKVAEKASYQVVVRGRSPSHYQNEGPNSASNHRGSGASGGGGGYNSLGGYTGYSSGFNTGGGPSLGRSYTNGYGMNGGYRSNGLALDPTSMHSHSVSSSSSVTGTDGYMDHSSSMLITSQAAPDFMQPAPVAYSGTGLPSIFAPSRMDDKFYIPSRIPPPMEVSTVY